jgi:hypothetical protein
MYHFQQGEAYLAWGMLGNAARSCIEMGLHHRETTTTIILNESELKWARRLFWSVYVLDRRFSFGCGLPFAFQDEDIDPCLPELVRIPPRSPQILSDNPLMPSVSAEQFCSLSEEYGDVHTNSISSLELRKA